MDDYIDEKIEEMITFPKQLRHEVIEAFRQIARFKENLRCGRLDGVSTKELYEKLHEEMQPLVRAFDLVYPTRFSEND